MITIRIATVEDAESIQKIYAPYVLNTTITFELEPPTVKEMADRISHTLEKYPYLVAVEEGEVIGYAYAGTLYDRRAYDHSAELSIYIDDGKRHKGIGHLLYNALIDYLTRILRIFMDVSLIQMMQVSLFMKNTVLKKPLISMNVAISLING